MIMAVTQMPVTRLAHTKLLLVFPLHTCQPSRLAPLPFIILLGGVLFTYVGTEVGYGGWLLEYAIQVCCLSRW